MEVDDANPPNTLSPPPRQLTPNTHKISHAMLKKLLIGLVILCVGGYVTYNIAYPTYTHRFRVTIAVDDNGKTHLGSSVMKRAEVSKSRSAMSGPGRTSKATRSSSTSAKKTMSWPFWDSMTMPNVQ